MKCDIQALKEHCVQCEELLQQIREKSAAVLPYEKVEEMDILCTVMNSEVKSVQGCISVYTKTAERVALSVRSIKL